MEQGNHLPHESYEYEMNEWNEFFKCKILHRIDVLKKTKKVERRSIVLLKKEFQKLFSELSSKSKKTYSRYVTAENQ